MRWFIVLGMMLAVMTTSVSAADLGGDNRVSLKDEEPYVRRFNWTGGYAGLQLGYGWADTDASSGPAGSFDQTYDYDNEGFIGGGHAGYNFQVGTVVYGIEADLEYADLNETSIGSLGNSHSTDIEWMGSIRARLGYAMDRTLIYVTGGWAFGEVDVTSESGALSNSETRNGWTIGGGLEYAMTNSITTRLEYRYTDFGNESFNTGSLNDESDVTIHAIRAGVSFKF